MGHIRHIGTAAAVAVVVTALAGGAVVVAQERDGVRNRSGSIVVAPAAAKPALRLSATPRTVDAGKVITFRVRTSTKHPRSVRLQRWDARRKVWRNAAKRTVRASATIRLKPATGSVRYRAVAPRVKHRSGGRTHVHATARTKTLVVTARAVKRTVPSRPATLTADEKTLLAAVRSARTTYARPGIQGAADRGAEACLTASARRHSAWMASLGRAVDPGSAEHRAAARPLPVADCPGRTVTTVTRAVGGSTAAAAVQGSVDAWLSSPYGETGRLLSACHDAPGFEYGIAAPVVGDTRWLTVLVASDTSATTGSGAC
ncbi:MULTISPECIES: hypothetical protein [Aeromicrobium]|uniref:hypothetical protein n=1 Tax=Aeromicrobium TaxID=2040 RepID=UPI00257AB2D9|nr:MULTISPECIES: hypothetical protein [Aeromicrobium]